MITLLPCCCCCCCCSDHRRQASSPAPDQPGESPIVHPTRPAILLAGQAFPPTTAPTRWEQQAQGNTGGHAGRAKRWCHQEWFLFDASSGLACMARCFTASVVLRDCLMRWRPTTLAGKDLYMRHEVLTSPQQHSTVPVLVCQCTTFVSACASMGTAGAGQHRWAGRVPRKLVLSRVSVFISDASSFVACMARCFTARVVNGVHFHVLAAHYPGREGILHDA
jgi:hypothetical protein